jgi:uncharacterized protein YkuJ
LDDSVSEEIAYELNSVNKVVKVTTSIINNSDTITWVETFQYGSNDKLSRVNGVNYFFTHEYNTSGQLTSSSYYYNNVLITRIYSFYNSNGQLARRTNGQSVNEYDYASISSKNAVKESVYSPQNTLHFTVEYEYDERSTPFDNIDLSWPITNVPSVNNVIKLTYTQITGLPGVHVTTYDYQYDNEGYPLQMISTSSFIQTVTYTYDCK